MSLVCKDAQRFLCRSCNQIASNAMILHCKSKYHAKQSELYCSKCMHAILLNKDAKCPFNDHLYPIFKPAIEQRLELGELNVFCPYANKRIIAKEDNKSNEDKMDDDMFLYDTDCGCIASGSKNDIEGMKQILSEDQEVIDSSSSDEDSTGCEWFGKYKYLSDHLENECKFIPIDHQLLRIKTQLSELRHEYNRNKAKHRSLCITSIFGIIVILLMLSGIIVWFSNQMEHLKSDPIIVNSNNDDITCDYNELYHEELTQYIDSMINSKYNEMEGFYYILKGDLDVFKNEIKYNIVHHKLKESYSKCADTKEEEMKEIKYDAIVEDLVSNAKSTYDEYKQQLDQIPFVQFVSNAIHSFQDEKEL